MIVEESDASRTKRVTRDPAEAPIRVGTRRACVIGCGRAHRRDAQIGLLVADALADDPPLQTSVRTSQAPGVDLLRGLVGVDLLVVVEAALAGSSFPVGRAARIEYMGPGVEGRMSLTPPGAAWRDAAPMLGVTYALKIGRDLKILPERVWVYVVSGGDFGYGARMSAGVSAAIVTTVAQIRADIEEWLAREGPTDA